jgi:hypothetical protein
MGHSVFLYSTTIYITSYAVNIFFDTAYRLSGLLTINFLAWSLKVPSSPSSILCHITLSLAIWRRGSYFPKIRAIQSAGDH